jgi:hypothetical protein
VFKIWVKDDHLLHSGMIQMVKCLNFLQVAVSASRHHYQHGIDNVDLYDRFFRGGHICAQGAFIQIV